MRPVPSQPRVSADALEGVRLKRRYQVLEKVSHGGMAWVYRGVDMSNRQLVAIKVLFAHLAHDHTAKERFRLEAQYQSQWQHPNIVRVIDYIEENALVGMVMDWVAGPSLQYLLEEEARPFDYGGIAALMLPLVEAIGYAHAHQVVHRDLKPSNILLQKVGPSYWPRVADFGIAKSLAPDGPMLTASNNVMGTVQYMAPEQILSAKHIDHRADIYSLGVIMYQLVTGRMLFAARGMHQWAYLQRKVKPAAPREFAPDVPSAFEFVILRCLEKEADKRYEDCAALRQALRATGLAKLADDTVYTVGEQTQPTLSSEALWEALGETTEKRQKGWVDDGILQPMQPAVLPTKSLPGDVNDGPTLAHESPLAGVTSDSSSELLSHDAAGAYASQELVSPLRDESTWSLFLYIGLFLCILGGGAFFFFSVWESDPTPPLKRLAVSCKDGERQSCYTGPPASLNRGLCRAGVKQCLNGVFGSCKGEILPAPQELCNERDDDCDGKVDEDFQAKGKACTTTVGACQYPGKQICRLDHLGLICQRAVVKPNDPIRRVQLTLSPKDVSFSLYIKGKRGATKRMRVRGAACLQLTQHSRVKLQAKGYESCSFPLRWKHQRLQLQLQKKSELFNAPHYCLQSGP